MCVRRPAGVVDACDSCSSSGVVALEPVGCRTSVASSSSTVVVATAVKPANGELRSRHINHVRRRRPPPPSRRRERINRRACRKFHALRPVTTATTRGALACCCKFKSPLVATSMRTVEIQRFCCAIRRPNNRQTKSQTRVEWRRSTLLN